MLRLNFVDKGVVTVVAFVEDKIMDERQIQEIGYQLFSLVDEFGKKFILLDFGNVKYFSSACLGKLITLHKKCKTAGGMLVICEMDAEGFRGNPDDSIYSVFEITKLNKLFNIHTKVPNDPGASFKAALKEFPEAA